jgi:hypothetical protein
MSARAATHARPGTGVASMQTPPARAIADAPTTIGRPAMTHAHFGQVAVSLQRAGRLESDAALETAADRVATHETGLHRAAPAQPRDQRLVERAAPMAANQVRGWSGRPLDASVRTGIEARLGGDFGRVRLHTDRAAARTAAALSARAFTVGEHVVFGEGQYAPGSAAGRALLAHELAHTAQQRATGAQVVQRDVADDVIDKLSYGLFDWAITDRESIDALALLGTLPDPDLAKTLAKMGNKFVDRLLDNLPDAAKTGEVYQRVIRALGVAGTMSYAKEQLDFGVFDWAITDAEVARVFNVFTTLPAAEQENFLAGLDSAKRLGRLLRNSGIGHFTLYIVPWMRTLTRGRLTDRQRAIMRTIAEESPDTPIDVLQQATEIRYDVVVGPTQMSGRTPSPWSAGKLRETYLALDHLPDAHVARNKELLRFGQFTKDQTASADGSSVAIVAGTYSQSDRELAVNIKDAEVPQAQGSTAQATAPKTDLKQTLIHETGHAVDAEMGWSAGAEPAKPERGGWKSFATHTDCAGRDPARQGRRRHGQCDGPGQRGSAQVRHRQAAMVHRIAEDDSGQRPRRQVARCVAYRPGDERRRAVVRARRGRREARHPDLPAELRAGLGELSACGACPHGRGAERHGTQIPVQGRRRMVRRVLCRLLHDGRTRQGRAARRQGREYQAVLRCFGRHARGVEMRRTR